MTSSPTIPQWIDLDGADNVRDVGGLPTDDGGVVRSGRLIRSDSLQQLSPADVRHLVDTVGVRAVVDLRTGVEVESEGPGPMTREPAVTIRHLSLFPEEGHNTDAAVTDADDDAPVVLPWQERDNALTDAERRHGASAVYLRYLNERADSIVAALRTIAYTDGATIVHCAAGKDRTGTVVALALAEVGATRAAIVDDYAASAERVEAIFARMRTTRTYAHDIGDEPVDKHKPRAASMRHLLDTLDELFGGASAWLRDHGWTEADAAALRRALRD
ncbi:MAG TPA: tyrosine-protein phosphatase [Jatrophihabitans sp.]|uniref:tyrosine-protein phosphatase n=1 Tax=Jatrophihabitans sp. TaxID=1932789 RepID=UPI002E0040A2|nr:tyrosine-protein phosphatase [Jatrophihabitans sp.]